MADLTVAVSESAFQRLFVVLRDSIRWEAQDNTNFGPFTAGYHVKGHLEGGSVDFRADNSVLIDELDVRWDKFQFTLGLDIPEICVGGGCINMPWPIPDICLPRWCVFSANPDISISPDLAAFVAQELSAAGRPVVRYYDASIPPPVIDPCGFLRDILVDNSIIDPFPDHNQWHIYLNPDFIDLDLFDFADVVGNLIENALTAAVTALLPGGWVRDLILAIIGGVADFIRWLLDIPDEIDEWLSDLFNISFGLGDLLIQLIGEFFGACVPLVRVDDPLEVLAKEISTSVLLSGTPVELVPVSVSVRNLSVRVDDVEMVLQADVGG